MIKYLLKKLLGEELDAKIHNYFLKGSFSSILLQLSLSLITFLTTIVIARLTGDKGFGVYTLVFTWVGIFSSFAVLGLDDLALRQIPVYKDKNDLKSAKSFLIWGNRTAIFGSILLSIIYMLSAYLLPLPGIKEYYFFHIIGALSIPFFSLIYFNQAVLRAWGKMGAGQFSEKVFQPVSFLTLLVSFFILGYTITDWYAILFRVISFILALVLLIYLLLKNLKPILLSDSIPINTKIWIKSCMYFSASTLLYALNTRLDIVFLGLFQTNPEQIAYYNVALKFSDIALIPYLVVCTVTTPMFASLYHQGKTQELQTFYTKITRISLVIICLIIIVFISFGPWFLSWYGQSFQKAYTVLVLLCITKIVHVFVGPANYLLSMIGKERYVTIALIFSVLFTVLLHLVLIPLFNINGAAIASLGGLLFFDIFLALYAFKSSGLWLTAFGKPFKK